MMTIIYYLHWLGLVMFEVIVLKQGVKVPYPDAGIPDYFLNYINHVWRNYDRVNLFDEMQALIFKDHNILITKALDENGVHCYTLEFQSQEDFIEFVLRWS